MHIQQISLPAGGVTERAPILGYLAFCLASWTRPENSSERFLPLPAPGILAFEQRLGEEYPLDNVGTDLGLGERVMYYIKPFLCNTCLYLCEKMGMRESISCIKLALERIHSTCRETARKTSVDSGYYSRGSSVIPQFLIKTRSVTSIPSKGFHCLPRSFARQSDAS